MSDEPITLEFFARQQQRLLDEMGLMRDQMGTMRDDMQVLTAMVLRLDGTVGLVLKELRAMHSQHSRLANRGGRLEEERESPGNRVRSHGAPTSVGVTSAPFALRAPVQ
jgi:hypothetical protein